MTVTRTDDTRIEQSGELLAPMQIMRELRANETVLSQVASARAAIHDVLRGTDDRMFIIVGPCSIHDPVAALDYARKLKPLADELAHELVIVMRVYFEKPRTTVGWKGLINDPHLDESFDINEGLWLARKLLLEINEIGLPCATEFLDLISPQYIADLVSWGAIGARTTESQSHRQLASGVSCPVGFKNGTDGSLRIAVDAIKAAAARHHFISITKSGHVGVFSTSGNEDTHVILRGGKAPNYDAASVDTACQELANAGLRQQVMIDFSHANSSKQHMKQVEVGADVAAQVSGGDTRIIGVMIESHLNSGRQDLVPGQALEYAKSITDACIGWDDTDPLLRQLASAVKKRRLTAPVGEE
ncbi:MAG: 3-deoxy-7-phosphoheptulonate synthase [Hydrogenophilales bacterium 16-64-46]|nr:MAG: 3-deoxy-7-phosphoheptulonate synthase [Hydrogenophilales bacterium 12-64-13]OYZ05164.1 MAG: 3-deoxy-7-phosphoheptulonate synthase [Hydrogenophilales bacterium 16-64-46]OZA37982.1 MAG: 3-deoxy-7-phosphoheptulonate synthase [Hydrogenophilales bacterium 17-64-34]HQT00484.1 3-deoxy-7-phosphoheptulonate synthase [Thiobacillus sp.]